MQNFILGTKQNIYKAKKIPTLQLSIYEEDEIGSLIINVEVLNS